MSGFGLRGVVLYVREKAAKWLHGECLDRCRMARCRKASVTFCDGFVHLPGLNCC